VWNVAGDAGTISTEPPMDPSYEAAEEGEDPGDGEEPGPACSMIAYFDQDFGKVEGGETSSAIWRQCSHIIITIFIIIIIINIIHFAHM